MRPLGKKKKKKSAEQLSSQFMRIVEKQIKKAFSVPDPILRKMLK